MLHERLISYLAAEKSESTFAYLVWLSLEFAALSSSRGVLGMLAITVRMPARTAAGGLHVVVSVCRLREPRVTARVE
jgi:hypothetical protein